jgi:hypothetical protein
MPELLEWGLLRVETNLGNKGVCAAGIRRAHPDEESRMVVTSQVISISGDRRKLTTEHTCYDLLQELPEAPEEHRRHHVWLLYLRGRSAPKRVEWLRSDWTVSAVADTHEIQEIIAQEAEARNLKL